MSALHGAFARTVAADRKMRCNPEDPISRARFWARLDELCAVARRSDDVRLAQAAWRAQTKREAAVTVYTMLAAGADPAAQEDAHG